MKLEFEHDYQQKVMYQTFAEATTLATPADVQAWRAAWMGALSSWHSPYKVLVDVSQLQIADDAKIATALELMVRFYNGFFLRKIIGYGHQEGRGHEHLPFPVHATREEAAVALGIRAPVKREKTDFRSQIQLQNDFQRHVVELNFAEPVVLETREQMATLRSKLTNNLMQWHSKWSLLVDCVNLEIAVAARPEFERMLTVLQGFFMKRTIGYSPRGPKESYPFPTFRARHRAAAELEAEGTFSGDQADCRSRKGAPAG